MGKGGGGGVYGCTYVVGCTWLGAAYCSLLSDYFYVCNFATVVNDLMQYCIGILLYYIITLPLSSIIVIIVHQHHHSIIIATITLTHHLPAHRCMLPQGQNY